MAALVVRRNYRDVFSGFGIHTRRTRVIKKLDQLSCAMRSAIWRALGH